MPNAIDLVAGQNLWTEQQRDLYNKLDFYLAKTQVEYFKQWTTWQKLLSPMKWQANMGPYMKGVRKVPAPVLRSTFVPQAINAMSKKDVIEVRETSEQVQLYKHRFESQLFQFLPNFQDFLSDSIDKTNEEIVQKIAIAQDLFLRTAIFHGSPKVWIAGKNDGTSELTEMLYWNGYTISEAKTTAALTAMCQKVGSNLSLKQIAKLGGAMTVDEGVPFFSGNILGDGSDGAGLKGKYLLLCSTEVWDNFPFDPHLLENRALNLDIVTSGFTGSLFGRWTAKFERYPLRITAAGAIPAPETLVVDAAAYNNGDTVVNPAYAAADYEVAFAIGAEAYKSITIGPPPAEFAKGEMSMGKFRAMDWNGKVSITKDVMTNVLDQNGTVVQDTNKYGEYAQLIAQAAMGILPVARKHIIPIIFKRQRVGGNA